MLELLKKLILWIRKFVREKFHSQNEDLPYYITIVIALVLFIITLNAFADLTEELAEDKLGPFDRAVTDFVLSYRSEGLTLFFRFITDFGDRYAYLVITLILTIYFLLKHQRYKFIIQKVLVLVLATLSQIVLKKAINRARPTLEHLVTVSTLSYPSGHAMGAMAFYGFLIYLSLRYKMQRWSRILTITVLSLLIFFIGLSRVYLGVHYPSDVAAGFIGGLIWIAFCVIVFNVIGLLRNRKIRRKNSISTE